MDMDLKAYKLSKSKVEALVGKDKKYDHFRKLMDLGIDFIIPAKKDNEILSDMEGLSKIKGYSQAIGKRVS